jgi:predicted nucleic-acid-binding protein
VLHVELPYLRSLLGFVVVKIVNLSMSQEIVVQVVEIIVKLNLFRVPAN